MAMIPRAKEAQGNGDLLCGRNHPMVEGKEMVKGNESLAKCLLL
jgi:hypothetical protein